MEVALLLPAYFFQVPAEPSPIIVKLIEPPGDPTGVANAIIQALGITGVITMLAVLCGVVLAVVMFWVRSRT